ncbi:glutaredoxin family protein [Jeotgalibaca ciconiae]|uniref:Glutaredoxin family protein n=1 Tax=Jeotgalibaca ciconiae TaxID=2496265 RepID=A0A3S9H9W8_9LACT|nr:glutaredoxin family protein [Jeotgalibaca ciconiae]AZP04124.1 glutaredoxin family protein [Jeotgalibaca ciconiae]HJB22683.1 glutaredoxin family protein [Candidatus Jeotgalibaca pullicola]
MEVSLYTKNNCGMCKNTKRYLQMIGVPFVEKNIEENEVYMDEARETGFTALPIVKTAEEVFSGHQPAKLEELFGSL